MNEDLSVRVRRFGLHGKSSGFFKLSLLERKSLWDDGKDSSFSLAFSVLRVPKFENKAFSIEVVQYFTTSNEFTDLNNDH